jgi:hypothetical protein
VSAITSSNDVQNPTRTDPLQHSGMAELGNHTQLLHAMLEQLRSGVQQIAVGDNEHQELVMSSFPVAGAKRIILRRVGAGGVIAVPTTGVRIMSGNVARLGGTVVNSGSNPVILYLTKDPAVLQGYPAIWLAASGGAWDLRLGNLLWYGNIVAVAQTGATTVTVAEV